MPTAHMKIVVTGSAGFIGSNVVAALRGRGDTVVGVDPRAPEPRSFDEAVSDGEVQRVVHLGAISSTLEDDEDLLTRVNVQLPQHIWRWCAREDVPLVYASSAAVYGMGMSGFEEDGLCEPLNGYARSKHAFDEWALLQDSGPPTWAGCRYFNVYGPGESHKGAMASMVTKTHWDIEAGRPTRLFRWGRQCRDFVWVGDVVEVTLWLLEADVAGLFNVGTGHAATFEHVVSATWRSEGLEPRVEWVDMPAELRDRYQAYTRADMRKLRAAGYERPFLGVDEGIAACATERVPC
ncbi:MAG: NAD-dependent epimerase/dehydratase family protein [Gemmatimonadota bacterium]|nr:NAD-dependent epimerase/dehydratase family protein [Gemmatimonadota bacterium]